MPETEKLFSKFTSTAKVLTSTPENFAEASLENLANVFSEKIVEDIQRNPDLLFIASTLLEIGYANRNGDAIMPYDFVPISDTFKMKYIDLEHKRSDIVGSINECGFTSNGIYVQKDLVSRLVELGERVEFVIGGYLWRVVNKELCQFIEESSSLEDGRASTSFEIMFEYYDICVSPTLRVLDGKIYAKGSKEFKQYNSTLKFKKGSGKVGDLNVFRILRGPIIPVGAGLVANPASGIKGVLALYGTVVIEEESVEQETVDHEEEVPVPEIKNNDEERNDNKEEDDGEKGEKLKLFTKKALFDGKIPEEMCDANITSFTNTVISNNIRIPSINTNDLSVNTKTTTIEKISNMPITIKKVEDIQSNWTELQKPEAQASVVTEFIKTKLEEESLRYAQELKAKEDAIANAETQKVAADEKIANLEAAHASLQAKLSDLEQKQAAADAQSAFDGRMAEVENEFELDEESEKIIVEEVRELPTDEAFANWFDKKKKLLKDKSKKAVKEKKDKAEAAKASAIAAGVKPEAFAGEEINFVEFLSNLKEVTANDAVTSVVTQTPNLKNEIQAKFANKTTINGKKFKK